MLLARISKKKGHLPFLTGGPLGLKKSLGRKVYQLIQSDKYPNDVNLRLILVPDFREPSEYRFRD